MKTKKSSDKHDDIDADLITVNNVFAHLRVKRYENDKQLILAFSTYEIYRYSNSMLKHLPKGSLKKLAKTIFYSKQAVYYNKATIDRWTHTSTTLNDIMDLSINKRIKKFQNQLKKNLSIVSF